VSVHHKIDEATGQQDESNCSDDLTAEGVSIFTLQLFVDCLYNQNRERLVDGLIDSQYFRVWDHSQIRVILHSVFMNFTFFFRHRASSRMTQSLKALGEESRAVLGPL
jgi:hypothetical protein